MKIKTSYHGTVELSGNPTAMLVVEMMIRDAAHYYELRHIQEMAKEARKIARQIRESDDVIGTIERKY